MSSEEQIKALIASIRLTSIATVITDPKLPDNPIIAVNSAFEQLTGYKAADLIGHNCRLLRGSDTEAEGSAVLREAVLEGKPAMTELLNYRRDGTSFRNAVMVAPLLDDDGAPILFIGSQMEVPDRGSDGGRRADEAARRLERLTARQRQVLQLMARGLLN